MPAPTALSSNLFKDASQKTKQRKGWRLLWNKWRVGISGSTITVMSALTSKSWRWCHTARQSCLINDAPLRTDVADQVQYNWQSYLVNTAKRYLSLRDYAFNQTLPQQLNVRNYKQLFHRPILVALRWWWHCQRKVYWGSVCLMMQRLATSRETHFCDLHVLELWL